MRFSFICDDAGETPRQTIDISVDDDTGRTVEMLVPAHRADSGDDERLRTLSPREARALGSLLTAAAAEAERAR